MTSQAGADRRLPARASGHDCPTQRFADRRVIVTGAGSGIGQATVARVLDEGATVVGYDVSADGPERTATAADNAGTGKQMTTAVLNVSSEAAVTAAVAAAVAELGGLVNFTSTAASFAHSHMAAYAASKGGLLSFTHSLALKYAKHGLRAVDIQPGGVSTALASSAPNKMPEGSDLGLWAKQTPLLHGDQNEILGDPNSVASVIAMVASDDGAFITGTEIRIDGGAHA
jgi:NAD(P)-dependent dehydrogenase (short-subunit alcohol dehydrogenase family)